MIRERITAQKRNRIFKCFKNDLTATERNGKVKNKKYKYTVLPLLAALFFSCTTTQRRAFIHLDASVKDYQWLPSRKIKNGGDYCSR